LIRCVHIYSMVGLLQGVVLHGFQWILSLEKRLKIKEVFLVPYKQSRPSSSNRCEIMVSSEPPRWGAWIEHMTRFHRRHQLMRCVYIRSMVGPPRGIIPHGFQWILSLKRRLAIKKMFLVSYKQSRLLSPKRYEIMISSNIFMNL
jgi:hypothetical protein